MEIKGNSGEETQRKGGVQLTRAEEVKESERKSKETKEIGA
jgi:hypothetical protein